MEGRDRQLIPLPFSSYDDHPNALTTMTVEVVRKVRREVWGAAHPRKGTVKLTSLGQDEGELIRGSDCSHRGPHGERSCSQHPMMNRPEQVPTHSK